MDRGTWQVTVHGVAESDTTEHIYSEYMLKCIFPFVKIQFSLSVMSVFVKIHFPPDMLQQGW